MGLFSRTPKPNPSITVEGVEIVMHRDGQWWQFNYRATDFCAFTPAFTLPTKAELDGMLSALESLESEMRSRVRQGITWAGPDSDDGASLSVNVQDFAATGAFTVSWSGGESWGDVGVDFTIKDGAIVDECWGD